MGRVGVDADVGLGDCACSRHYEVWGGGEEEEEEEGERAELVGLVKTLIWL